MMTPTFRVRPGQARTTQVWLPRRLRRCIIGITAARDKALVWRGKALDSTAPATMLRFRTRRAEGPSCMAYRWNWATGIDAEAREVIVRAFDPETLAPAPAAPHRDVAGRRYGFLETSQALPFDVFVKVFEHHSLGKRILHLWRRSNAAREFASAVRLHEMGLPVPQPLALVNESGNWGCRTCG